MIDKIRADLVLKCKQIDEERTMTRVKFDADMVMLENQKAYIESVIYDIDDMKNDLVQKNPVCINCLEFDKNKCKLDNIPKYAVQLNYHTCELGSW